MESGNSNRRNFIQNAAIGTLAALTMPQLVSSAFASEQTNSKIFLKENDTILFQGDSITDAGRVKTEAAFNNQKALGSGYAFMAAADLLNQYPGKNLKIYNKGISGNKVYQLAERWDKDALELKPNVLSILVGVNDYWHLLKHNYTGTLETYKTDFRKLLDRTFEHLPNVKLIIGEPFAIMGSSVDETWFPAFAEYQQAAREISDSYHAVLIPYQKIFNSALKLAPGAYWSPDGVHPSVAGARLMACAWNEAIKG